MLLRPLFSSARADDVSGAEEADAEEGDAEEAGTGGAKPVVGHRWTGAVWTGAKAARPSNPWACSMRSSSLDSIAEFSDEAPGSPNTWMFRRGDLFSDTTA